MKNSNFDIPVQQEAILKVICYYDFFNYPLTIEEIQKNISITCSPQNLLSDLNELRHIQLISKQDGHYFLPSHTSSIINERRKKEVLAEKTMKKALFFGRLIGAFPFVEGVCISGSLSKGVLEKDGDVDFFVITKSSRLWICRSFLILFKKTFLLNSHKYFCTNYFVDTANLSIPDENIFTATEVSCLLPIVNYGIYKEFISSNTWIKLHLPNVKLKENENCNPKNRHIVKRFSEFVLGGALGERIDNFFFKITLKRWKNKFPNFNEEDFNLNLRTRKNVSKHHPRGYQQRVLKAYEEKLETVLGLMKTKLAQVA